MDVYQQFRVRFSVLHVRLCVVRTENPIENGYRPSGCTWTVQELDIFFEHESRII